MTYQPDWSVVLDYRIWAAGISVTLAYAVTTILFGLLIGVALGLLSLSPYRVIKYLINIYVQVFRCTPLLVQIVWFFYALPMLTGFQTSSWVAAGAGLTLYMGAFATEIFRAGIMSIDAGQWQASRALGMSYTKMLAYVILPQAARRMIPPIVSQSILQVKNTSLLYIVAVPDIMYAASQLTARTYRPLESYTAVAVIYLAILYPLTVIAKRLETRSDL